LTKTVQDDEPRKVGLVMAALAVLVLAVDIEGKQAKTSIQDKLEGMLLLGAFGDALGAKNENVGLSDQISPDVSCVLSATGSFYNQTWQEQNCWGSESMRSLSLSPFLFDPFSRVLIVNLISTHDLQSGHRQVSSATRLAS